MSTHNMFWLKMVMMRFDWEVLAIGHILNKKVQEIVFEGL